LGDLLSGTRHGYQFVHETIRDRTKELFAARPQLRALLADRLSGRLAATNRSWAAFTLRRDDDPAVGERLANRSVREAVFTGSTRRLAEALEFLVHFYRERGERGPLLSVLLSLTDVRINQGRSRETTELIEEAAAVAIGLGDDEARWEVELVRASLELRRSTSAAALDRIRVLREEARANGRSRDVARLLLEEGVSFLGVNDVDRATPAFRQARTTFQQIGDAYGAGIALRNLIVSLAITPGGLAESERL